MAVNSADVKAEKRVDDSAAQRAAGRAGSTADRWVARWADVKAGSRADS